MINAIKIPTGATVILEIDGKQTFFKPIEGTIIGMNEFAPVPQSMVWQDGEWEYSFMNISKI